MSTPGATLTAYHALFESHLNYRMMSGEDHQARTYNDLSSAEEGTTDNGWYRKARQLQIDLQVVGNSDHK